MREFKNIPYERIQNAVVASDYLERENDDLLENNSSLKNLCVLVYYKEFIIS